MRSDRTSTAAPLTARLALCALVASAAPLHGQQSSADARYPIDPEAAPRPTVRAVRTTGAFRIDGVVEEAAWADAEAITDFVQSKPATGLPATERSEVRILYDDEKLYVGAILYDRDPAQLIARRMEQDFMSRDEDVFGLSLDTFLDRANAYYIMVNPNGAIRDAQAYDNSRTSNAEWEGVIETAATIHDEGWSVEIAIPFSTLRFDPGKPVQDWGLNILRRIRRKGEDALWAPVAFRTRLHRMDQAGTLTGLEGLRGSRNLMVKPFVLGGDVRGSSTPEADRGQNADGGLDVKWGITPRLTADLTWRTDFSQVEVDQEQVNLTRFSLFFPEKREFFVEGAGTYQFGDLSEREYRLGASPRDFTLFHSRRIGLEGGQPVPIVGGARVTGQVGKLQVGVLNMQTERLDSLAAENFTVARVRGTPVEGVELGGIFVNREATGGAPGYNRSWGVDANARVAGNLVIHSYLAGTREPDGGDDNHAGRLSAAWRGDFWDTSVLYRTFGENFDPGVGFVRRPGETHHYATLGVHPRAGFASLTELNPYVEAERFRAPGGSLRTRNATAGLTAHFLDGARLDLRATDRYEGVAEDFTLSQGTVPAGSYEFREASVGYTASAARVLSGTVRVSGGGYFQGDRRSFGGSLIWRPSAHVAIDLGVDHNVIDLTGTDFTVDVFGGRVDYAFSTKLIVGAWLQYNDATDDFVSNVRLNYIHAPLSDLFVVYAERRDTDSGVVLDRRISLKFTKLFAM